MTVRVYYYRCKKSVIGGLAALQASHIRHTCVRRKGSAMLPQAKRLDLDHFIFHHHVDPIARLRYDQRGAGEAAKRRQDPHARPK